MGTERTLQFVAHRGIDAMTITTKVTAEGFVRPSVVVIQLEDLG